MESVSKNIYVVLLAGGSGTRLWPSSRTHLPKQFTKILDKQTLFQETIRRIKGIVPLSRVFVITNKDYLDDIGRQEPMISPENIISEPERRDTAMALGVAAAYIYKQNPNAVIINLATDHVVGEIDKFQQTLLAAAKFVEDKKCLAAVGITPTFPHTGLGHIKMGEKITEINGVPVYKVDSFKEKPSLGTAKEYMKTGKYLWNACYFTWHAETFLNEFKRLSPDIYKYVQQIYESLGTDVEKETLVKAYSLVEKQAIDYAVAEKTDKLYVLPGNFTWNDIGDWKVVYDLSTKDENNNHVTIHGVDGRCIPVDTSNCLIQTNDQLIATIGVENLIIIDTRDALLICSKDRAQDVKELVKLLQEKHLQRYL